MTLKKIIIIISSLILLSGCMKTYLYISYSYGETKCEKKVDWNNPGFTVVRTIATKGANEK